MSRKLQISPKLALPTEAVTQTFAILAKRGVGKTYTASVMTEELLGAGLQVIVADPIGVWWGLRSSADGKKAGLPIIVLGGDHADAPLEVGAGELVADLAVDERLSLVLDLSRFRKGEQTRFMTDFCERLYHRNREPLHLVLDEADAFAPQRPMKGAGRLLGAVEDLVRRGRARGLGVTLVTQRAAVLNKNVLTQIEVLVALRTISPQDRDAIDEWVKVHGEPGQREELMESLPSLPVGTAWFWSPGWLDLFQRVEVRARETFDSSATPKAGARRVEPRTMADVDLEQLRKRMQATLERAKAEDPKELRRRVAQLERDLRKAQEASPEPQVEHVEIPILANGVVDRLEAAVTAIADAGKQLGDASSEIREELQRITSPASSPRTSARPPSASPPSRKPPAPPTTHRPGAPAADGERSVTPAQQRILNALASLELIGVTQPSKTQLALFAQASPKSSGYTNNLGALRTAGFIDYPTPGAAALTVDGRAIADSSSAPRSQDELLAFVQRLVGPARARIVDALVDAYPDSLPKELLADRAGASATSSGYTNNLGSLRSLGLIDYPSPGYAIATEILFLKAGASA